MKLTLVLFDQLERAGGGLARIELVVAHQQFGLASVQPPASLNSLTASSALRTWSLASARKGPVSGTGKPILIVPVGACARAAGALRMLASTAARHSDAVRAGMRIFMLVSRCCG